MRRFTIPIAVLITVACGGSATTTSPSTTTSAPPATTTAAPATTAPPATTTTAPPTTATTAPATTTAAATGDVVDIFAEDFAFTPAVVTIKAGDTVRWNLSSGTHTTTSGSGTPDGMWDQVITEDIPVLVTFDQAGEYPFYCRFHGDFMSGRVVVEP
jgi:plastocyanin